MRLPSRILSDSASWCAGSSEKLTPGDISCRCRGWAAPTCTREPNGRRSPRLTRQCFQMEHALLRANAPGQSDHSRLGRLWSCLYTVSGELSGGVIADNLAELYEDVLAVRGAATTYQVADRVAHDHPELLRATRERPRRP